MSGESDSTAVPPPGDLAEDVELPVELRDEVLLLERRLGAMTHYEALGLPWGAGADAASAAYFDRVRRFHPDRYGGRRLGSFRGRLDRVMARLTEARDALCDDGRRREYEARTAPPEEVARREAARIEDELRAGERRARLQRANPLVARAARVAELVARGKEHAAAGRHAAAVADLMTALALDPRHAEAPALAAESRRRAGAERAQDLLAEGLRAEAAGHDEPALERFAAAAELAPADPRPAAAAARAALRLGRTDDARRHAEAAVKAGPRHAPAFAALAAALAAVGDRAEARRTAERAIDLDPGQEDAKAVLKKLRWSPKLPWSPFR
jgi:tetratricopeptide (TPR) repeat protein